MRKKIALSLGLLLVFALPVFAQFGMGPFTADSYRLTQDLEVGSYSIDGDSTNGLGFDGDNNGNNEMNVNGNLVTITENDPAIKLDESTSGDTDWWIVNNSDQGGDDDDDLNIGNNATVGTSPLFTIYQEGGISTSGYNNVVVVDGIMYAQTDTGIEAAISAAGTNGAVFLPEATYTVSAPININTNGVTLFGVGRGSVLQLDNSKNVSVIALTSINVTLKDFTINGNKANQSSAGKGIETGWNTNGLLVENLYIYNTYSDGIYINGSSSMKIINNFIQNAGGDSIELLASRDIFITDNIIDSSAGNGVQVSGTNPNNAGRVSVIGNIIVDTQANSASSVHMYGCQDCIVSDNIIYDNPDGANGVNGIFIMGHSAYANAIVSNNRIEDVSGVGIEIQDGGCVVVGNRIKLTGTGSDQHGIFLSSDSLDTVVSDNVIENSYHHGIYLDNGIDRVNIVNNIVKNCDRADTGASAIRMIQSSGSDDDIHITGNFLYDDQGSPTQDYGIHADAGTFSGLVVKDNYFSGNTTASVANIPEIADNYPQTAQTIAAGNTITADRCGGVKKITSAGNVTTDTTNTFSAPSIVNTECCMTVINTGSNTITLDNNANFKSIGGADIVMTGDDATTVCSDGSVWYSTGSLVAN